MHQPHQICTRICRHTQANTPHPPTSLHLMTVCVSVAEQDSSRSSSFSELSGGRESEMYIQYGTGSCVLHLATDHVQVGSLLVPNQSVSQSVLTHTITDTSVSGHIN